MTPAANDFVAAVSHQLRTPLTVIKWSLDLAAASPTLTEEARALINGARQSSEEMLGALNDLHNFAREDSGDAPLASERVDLGALTWRVLRDMRWLATAQRHQVTVGTGGLDAHVLNDPLPLGQIFQHLLGNAIKYTPAGGRIGIALHGDDDAVAWTITDTGPGLPADLRERLMDRSWQADGLLPGSAGGPGVGLTVARRLLDRVGGTFAVQSNPGGGSTVTIRVPRRPAGPRTAAEAA